jgi:D-hydroxyproline dehydrogenase subunit gamma
MPESIRIFIDRKPVTVTSDISVAAAIAIADGMVTRRSVSGMLRAPLCGMGICQECRVTIDGIAQQLACQTICMPDMQVLTVLGAESP